jgi:excisionase family DNA binding protein
MTRRYISLTEAAEYLAISPRTMRRLISDGEIKGYRVGRGRLIRIDT